MDTVKGRLNNEAIQNRETLIVELLSHFSNFFIKLNQKDKFE